MHMLLLSAVCLSQSPHIDPAAAADHHNTCIHWGWGWANVIVSFFFFFFFFTYHTCLSDLSAAQFPEEESWDSLHPCNSVTTRKMHPQVYDFGNLENVCFTHRLLGGSLKSAWSALKYDTRPHQPHQTRFNQSIYVAVCVHCVQLSPQ